MQDTFELSQDALFERIERRGRKGMSVSQLVAALADEEGMDRSEARKLLRRALRDLVRDGRVVMGRGKHYFPVEATEMVPGMLRTFNAGYGVVRPDTGDGEPIRIERAGMRGAIHGDRVLVRLETPRGRARAAGHREGVVAKVLERAVSTVVGRWVVGDGRPHVRPVDKRLGLKILVTSSELDGEPKAGEFVVVSLDQVSERGGSARGRLLERLGEAGDPGVEERIVLRVFGIEEEFPPEALEEADSLDEGVAGPEIQGRWDLRDRPAVTVDPDTARDFDDAVSASPGRGDSIEVEVHIADVGHYVAEGSALDQAARDRSTSVYLPGRVVPMLPERLSADLCSLRPQVERFAFTVRYEVRADGTLGKRSARPSVIRSKWRCTYGEVASWLELEPAEWPAETAEFGDSLRLCAEVARRLSVDRRRRGSLDFDLAEPRLVLDETGEVVDVTPAPRTPAHRMIEELMVAANRCVAEILIQRSQPALHRVHDRPDATKLTDLAATLTDLGYRVKWDAETLGVRDLQALLDSAAGQPSERLVSMLVLRSMMRAVYSPDPRGHFALAADAYAHFTSPIRRYPDLVVHRALRRLLAEGRAVDGEAREAMETALESLGDHCSKREQRAEAAERMAVQWRTMRFLMDKVGEVVDGRVSGVTDFGLFVQLDEYAVDGLVHIAELVDDFYEHDAVAHCLVGSRTGRRWRLGDEIRVRLARVDEESMQLQLVPADMRPDAHATGPKGRPKGGSRRPREAAPAAPPKNRGARPKGTARPSRRGRGGRGKK